MMGSTGLVLAHSIKEHKQLTSYAGLLLASSEEKQEPSVRKSAVLLLGRLLMASLFVYVGITQASGLFWRAKVEGCCDLPAVTASTPPSPSARLPACLPVPAAMSPE